MTRCRVPQETAPFPLVEDAAGTAMGCSKRPGRWKAWLPVLALVLTLFSSPHVFAVEPSERLANPALEARAEAIGGTLRCLVCQNESIEESNASLAHDIRVLLRRRLLAGDTDAEARQAIVDRYGEFVLLDPPVRPATYVLWFAPAGLLVLGFIGIAVWMRRRPRSVAAVEPLDTTEQCRLERLLQESDG